MRRPWVSGGSPGHLGWVPRYHQRFGFGGPHGLVHVWRVVPHCVRWQLMPGRSRRKLQEGNQPVGKPLHILGLTARMGEPTIEPKLAQGHAFLRELA